MSSMHVTLKAGVVLIGIRTNGCFAIFAGSSYRGSICPTVEKIGWRYWEFREIEGSRNRGSNYRARVKQIQGKQGLARHIRKLEKPRVREIGIPLY